MFMRLCDPNRVGVYHRILYVYETLWSKQGWGLLLNPLHPVCLWDFCGLNRVGAYYWIPYILYVYETFVVQTGVGSTIESSTSCMFMRLLWSKQGWGLLLNPLHPVCLWDFCGPNRGGVYYRIQYILYVYETLWSKQGWGLLLNPLHPVCLWDFCGLNRVGAYYWRVGAYYWIPYILYVYETFVVQTGVGSTIESHTSCMFMRLLWSKQGWGLLLNPIHPVCLWDFCGLNRVGAYYWIPYILYVYETFVV